MIKYYHRNVLSVEGEAPFILAHGCNMLGVMGSGVAKAIKDRWPGCYSLYKRQIADGFVELGDVVTYQVPDVYGSYVVNCLTQETTGAGLQVDYEAIRDSIETTLIFAKHNGFKHIDTVPLGAGLGGGDWKIISKIFHILSEKYNVDILVSVYDEPTFIDVQAKDYWAGVSLESTKTLT